MFPGSTTRSVSPRRDRWRIQPLGNEPWQQLAKRRVPIVQHHCAWRTPGEAPGEALGLLAGRRPVLGGDRAGRPVLHDPAVQLESPTPASFGLVVLPTTTQIVEINVSESESSGTDYVTVDATVESGPVIPGPITVDGYYPPDLTLRPLRERLPLQAVPARRTGSAVRPQARLFGHGGLPPRVGQPDFCRAAARVRQRQRRRHCRAAHGRSAVGRRVAAGQGGRRGSPLRPAGRLLVRLDDRPAPGERGRRLGDLVLAAPADGGPRSSPRRHRPVPSTSRPSSVTSGSPSSPARSSGWRGALSWAHCRNSLTRAGR